MEGSRRPLRDRQRVARPADPAGLATQHPGGARASSRATASSRLRFVTTAGNWPRPRYTLTARAVPDGLPHELGSPTAPGRIVAEAGIRQGAGHPPAGGRQRRSRWPSSPSCPARASEEREIPFDPKPLTVGYQVQLDAIRDEVVDLVALRARLEKRMEAGSRAKTWRASRKGSRNTPLLPPRETVRRAAREAQGRGDPGAGRQEDRRADQEHPGPVQRASGAHRPLSRRRGLRQLHRGPGPKEGREEREGQGQGEGPERPRRKPLADAASRPRRSHRRPEARQDHGASSPATNTATPDPHRPSRTLPF